MKIEKLPLVLTKRLKSEFGKTILNKKKITTNFVKNKITTSLNPDEFSERKMSFRKEYNENFKKNHENVKSCTQINKNENLKKNENFNFNENKKSQNLKKCQNNIYNGNRYKKYLSEDNKKGLFICFKNYVRFKNKTSILKDISKKNNLNQPTQILLFENFKNINNKILNKISDKSFDRIRKQRLDREKNKKFMEMKLVIKERENLKFEKKEIKNEVRDFKKSPIKKNEKKGKKFNFKNSQNKYQVNNSKKSPIKKKEKKVENKENESKLKEDQKNHYFPILIKKLNNYGKEFLDLKKKILLIIKNKSETDMKLNFFVNEVRKGETIIEKISKNMKISDSCIKTTFQDSKMNLVQEKEINDFNTENN